MPLLAVASNRTSFSFSHCCSASVGFLIDAKLMIYATNGSGDVKRLKGTRGCRLRIGDWREREMIGQSCRFTSMNRQYDMIEGTSTSH
jgi:hypothetical protein